MNLEERHAEVTAIFLAACELPRAEQRVLVQQRCGSDSELRAEVEAMLMADDAGPDFLDSPESPGQIRLLAEESDRRAGVLERIGRYKIISILGKGGSAVVYLAEQENPVREVALKLLRPGITSRAAFRRLEQEAEILARLQHPGIAQIFEAGLAGSDGERSPYFAMEFVDGDPLCEFANSRSLGTHDRLELMLRVCAAVEHAHQRGVIHRDLKPTNILVDRSGNPKILDFGIARATDHDVHATTLRTDIGQLVGTIPYMSPEQTLGDPDALDTRSDIYSLGVVGYELLVGRLPHDLGRKLIHEAVRIIREEDIERPSTASAALRGDVETILLKALEKDQNRRYQTVTEFAADVRRYLHDEPILARPPSAAYQFRKFARRNRGLVTGMLIAAVALLVGASLAAWQAFRATHERNRAAISERTAVAEAKRATQAQQASRQEMEFLTNLLTQANADQPDFRNVTVRQAVDRAASQLDQQLNIDADVEQALRHTLGSTYVTLWEYDSAEKHLLRERELLQQRSEPDPLALANNATLISQILLQTGRATEAKPYIDEAIDAFRQARGEDDIETLGMKSQLARYYGAVGDDDSFMAEWQSILDTVRRTRNDSHPLAIEARAYLGLRYRAKRQFDQAEQLLTEVFEARKLAFGYDHVQTLTAMANLGLLYHDKGEEDRAISLLSDAMKGDRNVWGPSHHETYVCQINLIDSLRSAKRWEEVENLARDAVDRREMALRPNETVLSLKPLVALAQALNALNRPAEAIDWYDQVLAHPFFQQDPHQAARVRAVRGQCLVALGRFAEAEQDLLAAKETLDEETPPDVEFISRLLTWLIDAYEQSGQEQKAAAYREVQSSLAASSP